MKVWEQAVVQNVRKKGKTIVLFIIILVMGTAALIALAIAEGTQQAAADLRESLGGGFVMEARLDESDPKLWDVVETENGAAKAYIGPQIDNEVIGKVMQIEKIKDYNTEMFYVPYVKDIKFKPGFFASILDNESMQRWHPDIQMRTIRFYTSRKSELHQYFRSGAFELEEGRHIQEDDVNKVLISDELAKLNGLTLGDIVTAECRGWVSDGVSWDDVWGDPIKLEIVGIYTIHSNYEPSEYTQEWAWPENFFFVDDTTRRQCFQNWGFSERYENATFFVEDPKELEEVMKEVEQIDINWYYYQIRRDDLAYRSSVGPLNTMTTLAIILICVVLASCAALLYLILSMDVKSRKREMGIYLSMGRSKAKIVGQLVMEVVMIGLVALVMAGVIGKTVASPIGNAILQTVTPEEKEIGPPKIDMYLHVSFDTPNQTPEQIEIEVGAKEIGAVVAGGLMVMAGSVYLSALPILRMKPREVLSSMS